MAPHLRTELALAALDLALQHRQPPTGVIHHSDHGSQYSAAAFQQRCRTAGIRSSMGSIGDCYDNALAESFFATLECEVLARATFRTHAEARSALFDFIEVFYNRQRRHWGLRNNGEKSSGGVTHGHRLVILAHLHAELSPS
jgi:putative transposase